MTPKAPRISIPPPGLPAPTFIARPAPLRRLAESLLRQPVVAVDTESNSLYAYQEQVCLIQFSTPQADYLVDPLALDSLAPLGEVFSNPQLEKVFHAAEYDVICLRRDFGFELQHLFDTMTAARILGRGEVGLGSLLKAEFGVSLDKRFQRANWGQRPIPPHLLAYGQLDTHYLIALRNRLGAELKAKGLWPLALEDFQRLQGTNGRGSENRQPDCWRISGSYDLPPQNAAVLQQLCRYRDQQARSLNRPLFKVIGDQTLLQIAIDCPASLDDLRHIQGMTAQQVARHGGGLLEAVQCGLQSPPIHPPRQAKPSEAVLGRLESLRNWRKETARQMGVESDVVLPRDLLYILADQNPGSMAELAAIMKDLPWRREHFGEQILGVLSDG